MKSLIEEIDRLRVIRAAIFTLLVLNFSGCKNTGGISIMPNRGTNEVHPLNMDFADSVDSIEQTEKKVKNIPTMNYQVVKGDSLWKISRDYKTSVATISELNGLTGTLIREGQIILVPSENAPKSIENDESNGSNKAVSKEPSNPLIEAEENKQELPVVPAPIQEGDLLPVPEAP